MLVKSTMDDLSAAAHAVRDAIPDRGRVDATLDQIESVAASLRDAGIQALDYFDHLAMATARFNGSVDRTAETIRWCCVILTVAIIIDLAAGRLMA